MNGRFISQDYTKEEYLLNAINSIFEWSNSITISWIQKDQLVFSNYFERAYFASFIQEAFSKLFLDSLILKEVNLTEDGIELEIEIPEGSIFDNGFYPKNIRYKIYE